MLRFAHSSFVILALLVLSSGLSLAQDQPNILWIITDDQRADALVCYNQATTGQANSQLGYVESPNIDQLAAEGVLFVNAYCNSPACAPSRSSMHTGQYPHHSGRYGFEQTHTEYDINKQAIPEVLRNQGYGTAHFGKSGYYIFGWGPGQSFNQLPFYDLFVDFQGDLARKGFGDWSRYLDDETFHFPDGSTTVLTRGAYEDLSPGQQQARDNFDPRLDILRAYTRANSGLILGGVSSKSADETTDAYIVKEFINYLENSNREYQTFGGETVAGADTSSPLMIHLGFHFPHTPVLPPESFRKRFQDKHYNVPEFDLSELDRLPAQLKKEYQQMKIDGMSDADKQTLIQDYYAFCAFGDSLIGASVRAFKDYCESHDQDYLIVLASGDHGWHLGEQGISAKFAPWDMSNHTAVVVVSSDKTKYPSASVEEDYLEYVDFAPTFYAEAGIDISSESYNYLDGYDLAGVVDKSLSNRDYVYGEMNSVYGPRAYIRSGEFAFSMRVRDKNNQPSASYPPNNNIMWALTTSRENAEMALYDLRVDASERTNVAYDASYIALADWFRTKLGNIALGDGRVEVIWSEINTYDISNFAPGADDKLLDIPPDLIPDVSDYSEISFRVSKKKIDTTEPLNGARIKISGKVMVTDSLGLARAQIKPGSYNYTIEAAGCRGTSGTAIVSPESLSFADTLDAEYYLLNLKVISKKSEAAIAGAGVRFEDSTYTANEAGELSIDSLLYGEYEVCASAEGFLPLDCSKLHFQSDSSIILALSPLPYLQHFVVLNPWNKSPVPSAAIFVDNTALLADFLGKTSTELSNGSYQVSVSRERYEDHHSIIKVEEEGSHELFMNQIIADVKFRIHASGSALSSCTIIINEDTLQTSTSGIVTASDLEVGTVYDYSITHPSYAEIWEELVLYADSTLDHGMSLVDAASVSRRLKPQIYPNPVHSRLTIRGYGLSEQLQISDLAGRILLSQELNGQRSTIDLSRLPEGIYILKLKGAGLTKRIIKN